MAGDWIKMRTDLAEDPSVIDMASILQVHETHVVGMLHKAWSWADKQSQNGHAKNVTLSWLDRFIGVTGFGQAMVEVGWLTVENGLNFPNFDRHNGKSAKKRIEASERKRKQRAGHADVTDKSQKPRDKSATREEKRRVTTSVPKGTGAGAEKPTDPGKQEVWNTGRRLLVEQGMTKDVAGTFIGKLVKDYGQAAVLEAVREAERDPKAELKGWLTAACQKRAHPAANLGATKPLKGGPAFEPA